MKTALLALVGVLSLGALAPAAHAQTPPASTQSAAPNVQSTSIEALAADTRIKPILEKYLPGLFGNPFYPQIKSQTLTQVAPMSMGEITEEKLKQIQAEIDKLK